MKTRKFRIESRWPKWAKWRVVTPAPHSEQHSFDKRGLYWETWEQVMAAKIAMEACNAGEYRIVESVEDPICQALNEGKGVYKP